MSKIEKEALCTVFPEFSNEQEYVELAYLFGSTTESIEGPLSDIDIGTYLSYKLTKRKDRKHMELLGELSTLLNTDNLDLLVMNDASQVVNFEV
jgi:uncharacterized protein